MIISSGSLTTLKAGYEGLRDGIWIKGTKTTINKQTTHKYNK